MSFSDFARKAITTAMKETTKQADRQLRAYERRAKETGRPLPDKYYEMKEKNDHLKATIPTEKKNYNDW